MTQITRKSVPMRGLILLLAMFLSAGLVLSGCGDDDTATTPAPAPPPPPPPAPEPEPEPEPPAPEAPATPTGLHVDETTETSIEWHWNAVEGAIGYAVQVSLDEMFDATDKVVPTVETHYTESDLEPETSVYLRVAAASGTLEAPILSDWSTHVTGMSAMPPPPPPPAAPDPVMATFSLSDDADSPHFMVADDDDDEDTAMAWVNPEIMVESNSTAIITPMFVDDANGVSVDAGSNMPFTYVGAEDNWEMSQSMVLSDGATFMVQRTTVGANQEMEPTGDVMYITCGPFECAEGEDAPMLSIENSTICTAWDPSVEIQVGKVDNDVLDRATPADGELEVNDGVDLGIVTSSSLAMKVKHVFSGVSGGINTSSTVDAAKGSDKTLSMKAVGSFITVDADEDDAATANIDESDVCDNTYDSGRGSLFEPEGCFRLIGPGAGRADNDASKGANYLAGWSIELSPVGGDVGWGEVDWEDDPFEDLTCGAADPIMVSDHVDICEMFDAEVSLATAKGWKPEVVFNADNRVVMWRAGATKGTGTERFKTIWFDDNLNGKILKDTSARRPDPDGDGAGTAAGAAARIHDLKDQDEDDNNINKIWQWLTDADTDLMASVGDLGKVDMVSSRDNYQTADDERTITVEECAAGVSWTKGTTDDNSGCGSAGGANATVLNTDARKTNPDGNADNYETTTEGTETAATAAYTAANRNPISGADDFYKCSEDDGGDDADGSECDSEWTNDVTVTFADGTFGCSTTRDVTVTCTWDADGGMAQGRNALPDAFDGEGDGSNYAFFMKCEAK